MKTINIREEKHLNPNGSLKEMRQYSLQTTEEIGYEERIEDSLIKTNVIHNIDVQHFNGEVRWYDALSGEGMIRNLDTGGSVFFHCSSLDPKALHFPLESTPKVKSGDKLTFRMLCGQAHDIVLK